ncbi:MAG: NADPH-dependent FMN reductase [Planctomycetota bacterium]|jgi:NAD(P)H-dependent FMN reductase
MTSKVLAFAGSTRTDSFNKKLVRVAAAGARAAGADLTVVDLRDYPLPLYDGDLEAEHGLPENAVRLKELFHAHQGLLIAAPEYNGSITPVLKNAIDWVSRPAEGEKPLQCFDGKVAALMSASPGGLGGLRGLAAVRSILGGIRVLVLPQQVAVPQAHEAFGDGGRLNDAKRQSAVEALGAAVAETVAKLSA